jgi:phenylalanine-4-hydroxylase
LGFLLLKIMKTYEIELNSITKRLPKYLHKYIIKQPYDDYTGQNQAVWRYVMRSNVDFLQHVSYGDFVGGLKKTGIAIDDIPRMEGMNRILKNIGWAAVAVDGFIPPSVFMGFQANNVLVISAEIRTIKHIEYTPAPDIIHESAGHAPIIADPEYATYLKRFGEIGCKAFSKPQDDKLFHAIRELSTIKENPNSSEKSIKESSELVESLQNNMGELSEMAKIRNLHWWTVEYGLIGNIENPKIYGAGLLSSIKESKECLNKSLSKLPYNVNVAEVNFDITTPQPQLFITPSFKFLSEVLEQFVDKMSFKIGGLKGIQNAIDSEKIGTIELSSGVQISGIFSNVISDNGKPIYVQTSSPTALYVNGVEIPNHGTEYHKDGFGSPIGCLSFYSALSLEECSEEDLDALGIIVNKEVDIFFEGGIHVSGKLINKVYYPDNKYRRLRMLSFEDCTVTHDVDFQNQTTLFQPDWGTYDMVLGERITSAFCGPASYDSLEDDGIILSKKPPQIEYSDKQKLLHNLYKQVRIMRDKNDIKVDILQDIFLKIRNDFSGEWLLVLEIYELLYKSNLSFEKELLKYLESLKENIQISNLISTGLKLIRK